jgi:hypothetical protein
MDKYYSTNEEDYSHSDIEEAAKSAWNSDLECKVGDVITIWEGEALPFSASRFIPHMAEAMTEAAYDEMSDYSDSWTFSKEEEKSLQEAVAEAVDAWADKHDMQPKFFGATKVMPIQVRFTDEDGGCEIIPANAKGESQSPAKNL